MESNEKQNYKRFVNESDKPFFAAYLNSAKQNVFIILRDISENLGLSFDLSNDDNMPNACLWNYLKSNKEPEVSQRVIEKLEQQFNFANYLAKTNAYSKRKKRSAEPDDYIDVFNSLIKQLYLYRNYFSHVEHEKIQMDEEIIYGMKVLFDASRRKIKERFGLKTTDMNHLVRLGSRKNNGKNEVYEKDSFKYSFADKEKQITEKGLAFFICLWLQRKDAQEFLKNLEGFKRSESPSQKATLETFTFYHAKVPQPRLTSDNTTEGLLLDMINELKRCPKELYPLLNDADREKFKPVDEGKNSNLEEEYEAMPILKRNGNRFFYFALRFLDPAFKKIKFHIDLGNYCFHVYEQEIEGTFRKRRWIKRMTGFGNLEDFADEKRPPEWKDKIQKIEDREKDSGDIYVTETTPHYHINGNNIGLKFVNNYEKLTKDKIWPKLPEFEKNNKTRPNPTKPRNESPDCWLSLYELPAMVFYHLLRQNSDLPSAEDIIYNHRKQIKSFFKDIENNTLKPGIDLQSELNKRGLEKSDIPDIIYKYLISESPKTFNDKAEKRLEKLKNETAELLGRAERQTANYDKKPGSKDYIEMKCGHMADFLARDLIRLQKPTGKMEGKANSTEFQVLQAKLAFFGKNKDSLSETFKLCNLTGSENPHPFLHKIPLNQCRGILDFYKQYLKLRNTYLQSCIQDKKFNEYHFLKLGEKSRELTQNTILELAKKLQNEAVMNLPRGLFLKPILKALQSIEETKELAEELKSLERVNASYIIEKYFKKILHDQPQEFYGFKKSYELLDKLFDKRKEIEMRKSIEKQYFTTEELSKFTAKMSNDKKDNPVTRLLLKKIEEHINKKGIIKEEEKKGIADSYWRKYRDFTENEKQIRVAKTCDMVLFMAANDVLRKNFVVDKDILNKKKTGANQNLVEIEDCKLSNIKPDSDRGILSFQTKVELPVSFSYETNKDKIIKLNGAVSIRSGSKIKTIVKETIKIKNYGDFRGFLKDRRIVSLLPYITDDTIQFEALQKELELYGKARLEVFERIYEFEKKVIEEKKLRKINKNYIGHKDILKSLIGETDERFHLILQIRNAFSHSAYPEYALFKDIIDGSSFNQLKNYQSGDEKTLISIANQFKERLIKYYDELS